ncbi:MAG: C40 family peptidase [Eudoraea sp.]|nr:C40 family peptidase [Eudoraea sp.]
MKYGISELSIVPVRIEKNSSSAMCTQLLYGEYFKVLENKKKRCRIRTIPDGCEGWVDIRQITPLSKKEFTHLENLKRTKLCADLVSFIEGTNHLTPVVLGSRLNALKHLNQSFDGEIIRFSVKKKALPTLALSYLNAPYLEGGKTPFGIDASGLVQMVYRLYGKELARTIEGQSKAGEVLSFIEESVPGDLAFFDNSEGELNHVGIMLADHHIIHSFGKVRIDRIDHTGIFNREEKRYTHKLRMIKKIV